uniref:Uncharacterized protein n=1 Tax=Anguilla anguilla TaxID=7936 RepID=A0A0E9SF75_ANGAN
MKYNPQMSKVLLYVCITYRCISNTYIMSVCILSTIHNCLLIEVVHTEEILSLVP